MTAAHQPVDPKTVKIEPLADPLALKGFDSGEHEVDRHIPQCCDWHEKYRHRVFCAFLPGETQAVGFYCLGISASESKYLSEEIIRTSDGHAFVPFIYLIPESVHFESAASLIWNPVTGFSWLPRLKAK